MDSYTKLVELGASFFIEEAVKSIWSFCAPAFLQESDSVTSSVF